MEVDHVEDVDWLDFRICLLFFHLNLCLLSLGFHHLRLPLFFPAEHLGEQFEYELHNCQYLKCRTPYAPCLLWSLILQ